MSSHASWLQQVSGRQRFGLKGPRAAELLAQLQLNVPKAPNTWAPLRAGDAADSPDLICRLGNTEFFIEEQGDASGIAAIEPRARQLSGAYPVLREDFAVLLGGPHARDALAEVCNVDFSSLSTAGSPLVMTLMAGVAVVVVPQDARAEGGASTVYRIWCDPGFGPYLWETLNNIIGRDS